MQQLKTHIRPYTKEIQLKCQEILKRAKDHCTDDPVNWAAVHCSEVKFYEPMKTAVIFIDEASPCSFRLIEFVRKELNNIFPEIDFIVIPEW